MDKKTYRKFIKPIINQIKDQAGRIDKSTIMVFVIICFSCSIIILADLIVSNF